MVPAFTSVSEILSPTAPQPTIEPITPFGSSWKFPTSRLAEAGSTGNENMDSSAVGVDMGLSHLDGMVLPGQHQHQQRSLSDSDIPPMNNGNGSGNDGSDLIMTDFFDPDGRNMSSEPLDFGNWEFSSSSFNSDLPLPPTAHQTPSAGHGQTGSISDSEHHSTDTGEGSVNTPILDALGLGELNHDQPFGSGGAGGGHGGEASGTSMDFKW